MSLCGSSVPPGSPAPAPRPDEPRQPARAAQHAAEQQEPMTTTMISRPRRPPALPPGIGIGQAATAPARGNPQVVRRPWPRRSSIWSNPVLRFHLMAG